MKADQLAMMRRWRKEADDLAAAHALEPDRRIR